MRRTFTVVGVGEILWDLVPSGRQLGGAPANFAYCSRLLGDRALVVSRVGGDDLGADIRARLQGAGMSDEFLQTDPVHPTGTVRVELSPSGQPTFRIAYPAAWDFLESSEAIESLARSADAVCFGSLAQRSPDSRHMILTFLDSTPRETLRIFDVNLRQSFYSAEIVTTSIKRANAVKLNREELTRIAALLNLPASDERAFCRRALDKFDLKLICVTRGENGSRLVDRNGEDEHPGFQVCVKDAIGAGDAFTAGLVHEHLRGGSLTAMNDLANRMGAWVASCRGAMPPLPDDGLRNTLAKLHLK